MQNDRQGEEDWRRLLAVTRSRISGNGGDRPDERAPESFVNRIRILRKGLWAVARAIFWRRWSLVAAGIAIIVYLGFRFFYPEPGEPTIPPPDPPESLQP